MSLAIAPRTRVVVLGGAGGGGVPPTSRTLHVRALLERGYEVSCVPSAAPLEGGRLPFDVDLAIGDFGGGAPPDSSGLRWIDAHGLDAEALGAAVDGMREAPTAPTWKPWFPVIDYSRCTNCMQCLSFCLFDVYGVSPDRKIQVQNQNNCKTECPACSRVCPEVAIMFPKYRHGPINGEEVTSDDVRREAMKVDISALLGGDIYSMLRDRSDKAKSRFSKERDDSRALTERQNCLIALKRDLDVPPEVLAALPSPDEILAKSEAAAARAREALQGQPDAGRR